MRHYPKQVRVITILLIAAAGILIPFNFQPIAQDLTYHAFADTRAWLGIPNFGNVISNLPFIIVGLMGLRVLCRRWRDTEAFIHPRKRWFYIIFFASVAGVGLGSGYYHIAPNNHTLMWDRLPMTLAFMSLFAAIIAERIHITTGLALLPLLLTLGIASVVYWDYTESHGAGDLRPYALVQFLPMLLTPLLFWLFEPRYSDTRYFLGVMGWYLLAKLLEHFDAGIFVMTSHIVSGHSLKHLAAAMAVYQVVQWLQVRRKLA